MTHSHYVVVDAQKPAIEVVHDHPDMSVRHNWSNLVAFIVEGRAALAEVEHKDSSRGT